MAIDQSPLEDLLFITAKKNKNKANDFPDSPNRPPTYPITPPPGITHDDVTTPYDVILPDECGITRGYCPDCGTAPIKVKYGRIVNGSNAKPDEYPYHVLVRPLFGSVYRRCGGSIIKKRWILTAAHCFFDKDGNKADEVQVRVGSIYRSETKPVRVKAFYIHEDFDKIVTGDDIALIELTDDLLADDRPRVKAICVGEEVDIPFGGQVVATGWGAETYGSDDPHPNTLKEVLLDVITMELCQELVTVPADEKVICALTPFKDTCQGDSGGPLVAQLCDKQWAQVGIVSYGWGCAKPDHPGVYTRVSHYRPWIKKITGSEEC